MGFFSRLFGGGDDKPKPEQPKQPKRQLEEIVELEPIYLKNDEKVEAAEILYLDLETTGLNASKDEILQVSIMDDNGRIVYNSYVKPTRVTSWREAERINHISPSMVRNAPTLAQQKDKIGDILRSAKAICYYNASFDRSFLDEALFATLIYLNVDILEVAKATIKGLPNYKLTTVAGHLGFDYKAFPAHNAIVDVKATKYVLDYIDKHIKGFNKAEVIYAYKVKAKGGIVCEGRGVEGLTWEDANEKARRLYGTECVELNSVHYYGNSDLVTMGEAVAQRDLILAATQAQIQQPPTKQDLLYKKKIYLLGLLKDREIINRLSQAGATFINKPMKSASYVIIGEYSKNIARAYLTKAEELQLAGSKLQIVKESDIENIFNQE